MSKISLISVQRFERSRNVFNEDRKLKSILTNLVGVPQGSSTQNLKEIRAAIREKLKKQTSAQRRRQQRRRTQGDR